MVAHRDETIELNGNTFIRLSRTKKYAKIIPEEEIPMLLKTEFGISDIGKNL